MARIDMQEAVIDGVRGWLYRSGAFVPHGIKHPAHAEALQRRRFGGVDRPRCSATRKNGEFCRGFAMPGTGKCHTHQPPGWLDELDRRARETDDPRLLAWVAKRLNRRRARTRWRQNPWAPGRTVIVNDHTRRLMEEIAATAGTTLERLSPATVDWLAWQCRFQVERRATRSLAAIRDQMAVRIVVDGPCPYDGLQPDRTPASACWIQMGAPAA